MAKGKVGYCFSFLFVYFKILHLNCIFYKIKLLIMSPSCFYIKSVQALHGKSHVFVPKSKYINGNIKS